LGSAPDEGKAPSALDIAYIGCIASKGLAIIGRCIYALANDDHADPRQIPPYI
jgi:hypothetical protein